MEHNHPGVDNDRINGGTVVTVEMEQRVEKERGEGMEEEGGF